MITAEEVKGYMVLVAGDDGYEQHSVLFGINEIEHAQTFLKHTIKYNQAIMVAVLK
jgi:hypothetical protein